MPRLPLNLFVATLLAALVASCACPCPCAKDAQAVPVPPSVAKTVPAKWVVAGPANASTWDGLLRKYMHGDYFDYDGLHASSADRALLAAFLDWQGKVDVSKMSREEQIAFYINAYNSLNVKMVVENYPIHSPIDVPGYFDKIKHPVAGESLTVSEVEYDRLIANYGDMRAHFAVVCSDRGCLPLRDRAWAGATLDSDLDAVARKFVADERHFKVDHEKKQILISKIFEWYGEKFTKDATRPATRPEEYLKYWTTGADREALESGKYTVKIIEWNWTINEKAGA